MSFKLHKTDEAFAGLESILGSEYIMYDPQKRAYRYNLDCNMFQRYLYAAEDEYQRLLEHCKHQRDELAQWHKRYEGDGMDNIDGATEVERITDELREYAETLDRVAAMQSEHGFSPVAIKLRGIADRIDEKAAKLYADLTIGMQPMDEEHMAKDGWVKLPVDADGEVIRIGDRLVAGGREIAVLGIGRCYDGSEEFGVFAQCSEGDYEWFNAEYFRHVQPNSWEHLIKEAIEYGSENMHDVFFKTSEYDAKRDELVERCRRLADA